jgi:hypothetical protein
VLLLTRLTGRHEHRGPGRSSITAHAQIHIGQTWRTPKIAVGKVDEFDLSRETARAARAGLTLIRLMSPQGWCLTIRTIAAINTTRLTDLAAHLTNDPAATAGGVWQIWTSGGWRHAVTVPGPPDDRPSTVEQEPSA